MTRAVCYWICAWTIIVHAAAVIAPAVAGPVPVPVLQHECPRPTIISTVACPDPRAMANGAPWKCLHSRRVDRCSADEWGR